MSRSNLWQNCHKSIRDNKVFTYLLVIELRKRCFDPKTVAKDLEIPTERVRNWYHRCTGMTAVDLYLLIQKYDFMRMFVSINQVS